MSFIDEMNNNSNLTELNDFIKTVMSLSDEALTDEAIEAINNMISDGITQTVPYYFTYCVMGNIHV